MMKLVCSVLIVILILTNVAYADVIDQYYFDSIRKNASHP